jgi:hypothetical protein
VYANDSVLLQLVIHSGKTTAESAGHPSVENRSETKPKLSRK